MAVNSPSLGAPPPLPFVAVEPGTHTSDDEAAVWLTVQVPESAR
jgi:hypothetical protein